MYMYEYIFIKIWYKNKEDNWDFEIYNIQERLARSTILKQLHVESTLI